MTPLHVLLAGGGTAGHVEPALALADALRRLDPMIGITALGTARGLETRLVPARGYQLALIPPVPLPRSPTPTLLTVPSRLLAAVRAAGQVLERTGTDVVVGFGGYVALPAYLAARRAGTPMVVHEANVRPGLANRIGARLTPHVAVTTPGTPLPHAVTTGVPLRTAISTLDRPALRSMARAHFGLDADGPVLLVFGGSQGSRRINAAIAAAAPAAAAAGVQVLHATGPANLTTVTDALPPAQRGGPPYVVVPYLERMDLAYAAADAALCRAGAMTCAELTAVAMPAAYVPFPVGNGEQRLNAAAVVRAGGGLEVADADLDATWVSAHLLPLLSDPARLASTSEAAGRFGHRDADLALARMVLAAAGRTPS